MEEIKRLIEARQIEATKKQITLKLMCIVRNLGQGIYGDVGFGAGLGGSSLDTEAWMTPEERGEEMPTAEDGGEYSDMGYLFDALNIGHNFEVRWLVHDRELLAKYNGYTVYQEEEGKLKAYVPNKVWEDLMDRLYVRAKPVEEVNKTDAKKEHDAGFFRQAAKFMKELRDSWGI